MRQKLTVFLIIAIGAIKNIWLERLYDFQQVWSVNGSRVVASTREFCLHITAIVHGKKGWENEQKVLNKTSARG